MVGLGSVWAHHEARPELDELERWLRYRVLRVTPQYKYVEAWHVGASPESVPLDIRRRFPNGYRVSTRELYQTFDGGAWCAAAGRHFYQAPAISLEESGQRWRPMPDGAGYEAEAGE